MTKKNGNGNAVSSGNEPNSEEEFVIEITASWQKQVTSIIHTGNLLILAKKKLPHGKFTKMIENKLPFKTRTAQSLMTIASHKWISNPQHVAFLPPHWGTLIELCPISPEELELLKQQGKIHPEMTRGAAHGLPRWKHVPQALATLLYFEQHFTPEQLAPHVLDNGQGGWTQQQIEDSQPVLPPFITDLLTEMLRQSKERDAETEGLIAEIKTKHGKPGAQETHP